MQKWLSYKRNCIGTIWALPLLILFSPALFASTSVSLPDPSSILSTTSASAIITTIGIGMDHRPYEPATAMGTSIGLEMGVEVTLVQPPASLGTAVSDMANAVSGGNSSGGGGVVVPILPSLKLHLHKGLGAGIDIGFSVLPPVSSIPLIGSSFLIGGDIKVVIINPEEGPTWAIRGIYNINNLVLSTNGVLLDVKTATISPQLLVSKKLAFADPYMGIGLEYTYGSVLANIPLPSPAGVGLAPISLSQNGQGYGALFFCGIDLKIPNAGFRITLEGAYSPFGMNSLGTKIGFAF